MGRSLSSALRRVLHEERGWNLLELSLVMVVFVVILAAGLALMEGSAKSLPGEQERAHAIREAQTGLHRMTRELRQASRVVSWSSQSMEIEVRARNTDPATAATNPYVDRHVYYECGDLNPGRCKRFETEVGHVLPSEGTTVIDRIQNWNTEDPARKIFSFPDGSLDPTSVQVRIEVPAAGERPTSAGADHKIVLEDGFTIRNTGS